MVFTPVMTRLLHLAWIFGEEVVYDLRVNGDVRIA
jgi:hypothetical protein